MEHAGFQKASNQLHRNYHVRRATNDDLSKVVKLLADSYLPTMDIDLRKVNIYLYRQGAELVGVSGLEQYGEMGLLRSVAVEKQFQGKAWGKEIVLKTISTAKELHISRLYLLTTTASRFFEQLGFVPINREQVPPAIAASDEFAHICPDSAVCMEYMLKGPK